MKLKLRANDNRRSWRVWLLDDAGEMVDSTTIVRSEVTTEKGVIRRARKWAARAGHVKHGICVPAEVERERV